MSMEIPRQSDRAFGLSFAVIFAIIGLIGWYFFDARPYWAAVVGGIFGVLALVAPSVLMPLNRLWNLLAGKLSWVSNRLILGLFFLVCIVPLGVAMRLAGRDPLALVWDRKAATYFSPVRRQTTTETFRDQF